VLSDSTQSVTVGTALEWSVSGELVGASGEAIEVRRVGDEVKVVLGERGVQAPRLVAHAARDYVRFGGRNYRGRLEFFVGRDGGVVVLNVLPLEDYLLGVVPSEMPSHWPAAALQAQAVAARTYAVSRMLNRSDDTFDVYATVSDQVYYGVSGEKPAATEAIRATVGQIVTFSGKPIVAYYCSDAGGCTKCGTEPYLQAVPIESPDSPHNEWSIPLSREELGKLAEKAGAPVGTVKSIRSEQDPGSGHLVKLTVTGDKGRAQIKGNTLRSLLGLSTMKSTRAWVQIAGQPLSKPAVSAPIPKVAKPQLEAQDAGDVVEIAVSGDGDVVEGESPTLPPHSRPFIAHAKGVGTKKLRTSYISDGEHLVNCAMEVVLATAPAVTPLAAPVVVVAEHVKPLASEAKRSGKPQPPQVIAGVSGAVGPEGIILHGKGYGHGMGMSQWGAKTLAERGMSYEQILSYFYSGVRIEEVPRALGSVALAKPPKPAAAVKEEPTAEEAVSVQRSKFAPGR
jgi:stage II sporulation protein D